MMRNRGMGLCLRRETILEETPNLSIETKNEGDIAIKIVHTPRGDLVTRSKVHTGRIKDDGMDLDIEGLIKGVENYDAAIYMIEDTIFHMDKSIYDDACRDVGTDGIVRDTALQPPYGATRYLYGGASGLLRWIQDQHDHPGQFDRLMEAVVSRRKNDWSSSWIHLPNSLLSAIWMAPGDRIKSGNTICPCTRNGCPS